jgi:hypothetical protein
MNSLKLEMKICDEKYFLHYIYYLLKVLIQQYVKKSKTANPQIMNGLNEYAYEITSYFNFIFCYYNCIDNKI